MGEPITTGLPIRLDAKRFASLSLYFYAIGVLMALISLFIIFIIIVGTIAAIPSKYLDAIGRVFIVEGIISLTLNVVGQTFLSIFALYGGFKGGKMILSGNLAVWPDLVRRLGILYFLGTLFTTVGFIIAPEAAVGTHASIILLIHSVLLMISAYIVANVQWSLVTGILIIISAALPLSIIGSIPGQALSYCAILQTALPVATLQAIALIIVGIALILRSFILRWPIPSLTAAIGGLLFTIGLAYSGFSATSSIVSFLDQLNRLQRYPGWYPGWYVAGGFESTMITGLQAFLYVLLVSTILIGVSGILGLIALSLVISSNVRTLLPQITPTTTPPVTTAPASYCPSCGSPVSPDDLYCARCGRRLR